MKKKCTHCQLVNYATADACLRCNADLGKVIHAEEPRKGLFRRLAFRAAVVSGACILILAGFYMSLIVSAKRLTPEQRGTVQRASALVREAGFGTEAMLLSRFTAFRSSDHWLNAAVAKENAYAATNFPFMIMTLYPDFFTYPVDDVEQAAILLHEARHLAGDGEKEAYEFVWRNRKRLGWEKEKYIASDVWINIRHQTREHVPELFVCPDKGFMDCTE